MNEQQQKALRILKLSNLLFLDKVENNITHLDPMRSAALILNDELDRLKEEESALEHKGIKC